MKTSPTPKKSFLAYLAAFASAGSMGPEHTTRAFAETLFAPVPPTGPKTDPRAITPFRVAVPEAGLHDLRERLARTRWPDAAPAGDWIQGTHAGYLRELMDYWQSGFDWRAQENRLNEFPQFTTEIDGSLLHFIHARGRGPKPLPLVLTHGWPSSFAEFSKLVPLLTDPAAHGGDPADAFDVVVPSLPGYGFSARPLNPGMTTTTIAALWAKLMTERLGYPRFCAHGGDIGAGVTNRLGLYHPGVLHGIHVMAVLPPWLGEGSPPLSVEEKDYQKLLTDWELDEGAYGHLQRTRPQTIAYGLNDSPAGLAAWIVEKLRSWSECEGNIETRFTKDDQLTTVMLYWLTETFGSSVRLYADNARHSPTIGPNDKIRVPAGIALTTEPVDRVPRARAERSYIDIRHWTEFSRGGHFMAHEEPALLAADLRTFFRQFRQDKKPSANQPAPQILAGQSA